MNFWSTWVVSWPEWGRDKRRIKDILPSILCEFGYHYVYSYFLKKYFQSSSWLLNGYSVWWFNWTPGISCHWAGLSMMLIAHRLQQETRSCGLEGLTLYTLRLKRCLLTLVSLYYTEVWIFMYIPINLDLFGDFLLLLMRILFHFNDSLFNFLIGFSYVCA